MRGLILLGRTPVQEARGGRGSALQKPNAGASTLVSLVAGLDFEPREEAGQLTVFGKGGKTRVVLLPASVWRSLGPLPGEAGPDEPMFR